MSLFVEVHSEEKKCQVIINLDHIVEIAPLKDGGCILYTVDGAGMNSKMGLKVTDSYELFKQFAMQTVTAEDIAKRFPQATSKKASKDKEPEKFGFDFNDIPKL
jgi:hypothetical protein